MKDEVRSKIEERLAEIKKKNNIKNFMLEHIANEEKDLKKDLRVIRDAIQYVINLRHKIKNTTEKKLLTMVNKDKDLKALYEETVRMSNLTFDEYSEEFDKRVEKGEINE